MSAKRGHRPCTCQFCKWHKADGELYVCAKCFKPWPCPEATPNG